MPVYMVERSLGGIASADLSAAQRAAIDTATRIDASGTSVRYLRSTFVPEGGLCMCLFEAGDLATVQRVNEQAGLPFDRIVEALDLAP